MIPGRSLPALAVQGGAGTSGLSPPGQPYGRTLRAQAGRQLALASQAQAVVGQLFRCSLRIRQTQVSLNDEDQLKIKSHNTPTPLTQSII